MSDTLNTIFKDSNIDLESPATPLLYACVKLNDCNGVQIMRRYEGRARLSAAQIRAARAWFNWTQEELAQRSGVSQKSIARYELELSVPYENSLAKIRDAFEAAGISFQFEGTVSKGIRVL